MARLSPDEISQQLEALPGWECKDNSIGKQFRFRRFMDGIEFIRRVAELAEAADHHPDIQVNYTSVTMACSTHSEGGVTAKDIRLAGEIEAARTAMAE